MKRKSCCTSLKEISVEFGFAHNQSKFGELPTANARALCLIAIALITSACSPQIRNSLRFPSVLSPISAPAIPTKLAFGVMPPASAMSAVVLGTQPSVQVEDSSGNLFSSATNAVTLSAYTDSSCTLAASGIIAATTNPLNAVAGSALFLSATYTGPAGTIYIQASAAGLSSACSSAILISPDIRMVSAGEDEHTCALSSQGTVSCWGMNNAGQLGNASSTNSLFPVQVVGVGGTGFLSGIVSISAGANSTCALSGSGNVYCWGANNGGQLGNNSTTGSSTPVQVQGVGGSGFLSGVAFISVGPNAGTNTNNACAIVNPGGNVYCWGNNLVGQLGNGSTTPSLTPVQVVGGAEGTAFLSNAITVAAGNEAVCAVVSPSGSIYCWGAAVDGQLGNGVNTGSFTTPVEVTGVGGSGFLSSATSISMGYSSACALVSPGGNVYCWGLDFQGVNSDTPIEIPGVGGSGFLSGMTSVKTGGAGSCALSNSGNIYCWGLGTQGQLGNNSTGNSTPPVEVSGIAGSGVLSANTSISEGLYGVCSTSSSGNVFCWGQNTYGELGNNTTTSTSTPLEVFNPSVSAISAGTGAACAVSGSGNVYCWGNNSNGQLGNNSTTESHIPVEVVGVGGVGFLSKIASVSTNETTSCALSTSGNAYCWGSNVNGQLGNNSTTESHTPVEVVGVGGSGFLSGILSLGTSSEATCALVSDNVYCWGSNGFGGLGNGTNTASLTPIVVQGVGGSGTLFPISAIAVGGYTNCAASISGHVYCWGGGVGGTLGNGANANSTTPVEVVGVGGSGFLSGILSVSLNSPNTACAFSSSGNIYCWGVNSYGSMGNGTTVNSNSPVEVVGVGGSGNLTGIVSIATTVENTCGASSSGNVYCWGDNTFGALGDNSTTASNTPIEVLDLSGVGNLTGIQAVSEGDLSTCASSGSGNAYCWGSNQFGQLGNNSTTNSSLPIQVLNLPASINLQL